MVLIVVPDMEKACILLSGIVLYRKKMVLLGSAIKARFFGSLLNSRSSQVQLQRAVKLCGDAVEFIFLEGRILVNKIIVI